MTSFHNQFELVVEASPNAMVVVNDAGEIVYVNVQAEKLFGYPRAELLGRSVELLVPERFRHGHVSLRHVFSQAPVARPMGAGRDLYGVRKDGTEIPIEIGLNPIVSDQGTFVLAAITDITERKRAEELRLLNARVQERSKELEILNRELEAASRFKSQFVATMSHELRTPLNAIIGMVELLSKTKLDERQREHVQAINESADALLSIINSILDFSKIEAGKMDLRTTTFSVGSVVSGALDVLALQAREKGLALQVDVDPSIPAVQGDPDRLRQILLNLVGNAIKFTERGHVGVRVRPVDPEGPALVLRFDVEDTGIGIPPEVVPALFEPFVQADSSASRRYGGTGLGLSIAKRLVEMMGGEIGAEPRAGGGSIFWFTARLTRARETLPHPGRIEPDSTGGLESGVVLVAEDNARLQRLLKLQFDELAVPVRFASDGLEAVDAARTDQFAMIFMDCQMPNMDGYAATQAIRNEEKASGRHVPIVAMTANAFAEDREACLAAGMDDYLAKPVKLAELRNMIERWSKRSVRGS